MMFLGLNDWAQLLDLDGMWGCCETGRDDKETGIILIMIGLWGMSQLSSWKGSYCSPICFHFRSFGE